jgi:NAD(P)-dependent dehydrogenase (short-subunit alcohol dehydrogenase family)
MKTLLVTGADRGIGEALCVELQERGERVIAACLGDSPTLRARGVRVEPGVDVTSDTAVGALAERLHDERLDVIVNIAGVVHGGALGSLDFGNFDTSTR